jgi:CheY-like chemotaxis protein/anti-sigma regulatory factor (Ser/Thr protein kinase)
VTVDRVQLELAILNLVANARDAMEDGGEATIVTRNVAGERERVLITVADTGTGMSADVVSSAFEPFFTTKDPGKGTGLGLSMVYGFAKQAGGSVAIDSAPEIGTTVTISLPRAIGVQPVSVAVKQAPPPPKGLAILLVDDDAAARDPTEAMLRELGCTVTAAASAAAALEILRSDARFDVLLLDYAMPEMNGAQLAVLVRQLRPSLLIVFITGFIEEALLERLRPLGARVLTKPFGFEALSDALGQAAADIAAD